MTQHRMDNRHIFLKLPPRESTKDGEKVYRCSGPFCPGLPYSPAEVAHPVSCRRPFEGTD